MKFLYYSSHVSALAGHSSSNITVYTSSLYFFSLNPVTKFANSPPFGKINLDLSTTFILIKFSN